MQIGAYSISELAQRVNDWCQGHRVEPMHNRVGELVTVRNIRYYQSLGLVDRPTGAHGKGFTEKHRLQLVAIRLLQAKGLPLEKIQSLLYGRAEEELAEVERRGVAELEATPRASVANPATDWAVTPLGEDFLLLSRSRRGITAPQKQRIMEILNLAEAAEPVNEPPSYEPDGFRPEID